MAKIQEGYMPFKGYRTYYRIVGECEEGKLPLLALHGGPGCAHDYLESLDGIADKYGRAVYYYDAIGCGRSPVPPGNMDMYCQELFEEELVEIRKYLKLDHVHILGQSWGGMLAMLYATHHPVGVESMIVASSPASADRWLKDANILRSYLPPEMQEALNKADEDGDTSSPEYKAAYDEYYRRHVCKLDPYPDFVTRSFSQMGEPYWAMQGNSEFVMTGKMASYDVTADLPSVTIPTLVTSGQLDEATPFMEKEVYDLIPDCKWELIPGGTHMGFCTNPEPYIQSAEKFLEEND